MSYNPYSSRYSSYGNGTSKSPYSSNYATSSLLGHDYPYYSSGSGYLQNGLGRSSGKTLTAPSSGRYGKSLSVSPERFSRSVSPSRFGGAKTVSARPKTSRLPHSKSVESLAAKKSSKSANYNGSTDDKYANRFGSSSSLSDSRVGSTSSLGSSVDDADNKDYRKLYYDEKEESDKLRAELRKKESELEKTKEQLKKALQNNTKNETEKKERRALERKLSELEEEVKSLTKAKSENEKLKAENRALTRTVSKLSKKS